MDKDTEKKDKLRQMSENLRRKAIETQEALDFAQNANDVSEESLARQHKQIEETIKKLKLQLMQRADTEAKLRARIESIERKTKPKDEPRTFAKPTTSEEAEVEAPSAEARAEGFSFKTQEQILESGTLREKIRLYICYLDEDNYFGSEKSLSNEDMKKISSSVKTIEDRKAVEVYFREYQTLKKFGVVLRYYFKRFQTSFAFLAKQLYLLDKYEAEVETYNAVLTSFLAIPSSEAEGEILHFKTEEDKREAVKKLASNLAKIASKSISGEVIHLDLEQMELSLNLQKGKHLADIQKEAKEVEDSLADFKAYALVAEDYCKKSKLKYLPISIQICVENAEEERYIRYLVDNLTYFRSEFNNRKYRGETITPEEYLRAFIPDYFEVEPSKDVLADCKDGIKRIEKSLRK